MTDKKPKCQVANCENEATKRNRVSELLYCDEHAAMPHHYKIKNKRVPFKYDKIEG